MQRVNGIGGVFLYVNDPASMAKWYSDALGIDFTRNEECDNFYTEFQQCDPDDPARKANTVFAIFRADPPLPKEGRGCRLNWRVTDLPAMIRQLQSHGCKIDKHETYDYGDFAWTTDPEGNSIELYQPK